MMELWLSYLSGTLLHVEALDCGPTMYLPPNLVSMPRFVRLISNSLILFGKYVYGNSLWKWKR